MEEPQVDLSRQTFLLINSPLVALTFAANVFFAWCLILPPRDRLTPKPLLRMLLSYLAFCSVAYCAILPAMYCVEEDVNVFAILSATMLYLMHTSFTCYVWLNLLCYVQIVPARQAFWVWVKRNRKSLIHAAMFLDQMVFIFQSVADAEGIRCNFASSSPNTTLHECISVFTSASSYFCRGYIVSCLCVTSVSSLSTACYLCGHMRNMVRSCNAAGKQKVQSQMRVTAAGITQGVFYCLYTILYLVDTLMVVHYKRFFFGYWVGLTVTTFYMAVTTLNLAVGQVVFRQRIAGMWTAIAALCAVTRVAMDGPPASLETVDVKVS